MPFKKFDLSTFGELLIDFTYQGLNEYGMKMFAQNAGGAPANVVSAVAKLGLKTAFLGKVGADLHGDFLEKTLFEQNVNIDGLIKSHEYFTTLAFVDLDKNGERSFSFARKHGADVMMSKDEINVDIIKNSKIFHVGSLSMTSEINKETTLYALKQAKENNVLISYDPNYRASLWENENIAREEMKSLIPFADLMKISDEEIELMTGENDIMKAGKNLISQGVRVLVVTAGSKGAYLFYKDEVYFVESIKTSVVDTTGAGDAFWGGFLYKILQLEDITNIPSDELINFVKFATVVASICISKQGAIQAMPTFEEVDKFFI